MESVESATRWRQWSVQGTGDVLAQILDRLDKMPHGWKRLRGEELPAHQAPARPGSAWYSLEATPTRAGVTLSLERVGDSELRGGGIWFAGPQHLAPPPELPAAWEQVMRFLDEGIVPAARATGASVRVPSVEDLFLVDLPPGVAEGLRTFSQSARKVLPLRAREAELWRDFVIAAYRDQAVLDERRFVDWLVHAGWKRDAATELNLRFFDQCQLLDRYADEVSVA